MAVTWLRAGRIPVSGSEPHRMTTDTDSGACNVAVLRISAKTNLLITSRAIVSMIHRHQYAEVQALGRFSVRRAEQAIGRAATLLEMEGIKIDYKSRVIDPDVDGNEKAGMRFIIRVVDAAGISSRTGGAVGMIGHNK